MGTLLPTAAAAAAASQPRLIPIDHKVFTANGVLGGHYLQQGTWASTKPVPDGHVWLIKRVAVWLVATINRDAIPPPHVTFCVLADSPTGLNPPTALTQHIASMDIELAAGSGDLVIPHQAIFEPSQPLAIAAGDVLAALIYPVWGVAPDQRGTWGWRVDYIDTIRR